MTPRFGQILPRQRYTPRPGAYALLLRGTQVLLTFQEAPEPEYQLPGGGIERGESPYHALHREVAEETGWTISQPRFLMRYRRFCYMPDYDLWAEKICSVWLARPALRLGPPSEPGHRAEWVDLRDTLGLLPDAGSREAVRRALRILA